MTTGAKKKNAKKVCSVDDGTAVAVIWLLGSSNITVNIVNITFHDHDVHHCDANFTLHKLALHSRCLI